MHTLVIAEHQKGVLNSSTLSAVTAALELGLPVDLLLMGTDLAGVIEQAQSTVGVSKVLKVEAVQLAKPLAEPCTDVLLSLSEKYTHFVFAATSTGKDIAPRFAALLDVAPVSDVTRIVSECVFERPIYAGNATALLESLDRQKVLTVRVSAFKPAQANRETLAEAISLPVELSNDYPVQWLSEELTVSDRPELGQAKIIVSGGRGLSSKENFKSVLEPLADQLHAAVGASRAAVDAGYASNDLQIGQTGKIVAPELYLACGISGAIQHLAGMKDSKVIVAINKDPEAPIFAIADYGLTQDLFEAVPELIQSLKSTQSMKSVKA